MYGYAYKGLKANFLIFRSQGHNSNNEVNWVKASPINFIVVGRQSMAKSCRGVAAPKRLKTAAPS